MGHPIIAERHVVQTSATGEVMTFEDTTAGGPTVVLVHDLCASSGAWSIAPAFDALRAARRIVAVELPGCGASPAPEEPWEREPYVSALEDVLRDVARRHGGAADLVAFGLGGEIAARAAYRQPHLVRSLAVLRPTGFGPASKACRALGERAFTMATTMLAAFGSFAPAVWDPWVAEAVYADLPVPVVFVEAPFTEVVALDAFWRALPTKPALRLVPGDRRGRDAKSGKGAHARLGRFRPLRLA